MNQLTHDDGARQAEERLRVQLAGLAVGTRVPPERELAHQLGLGRTVLRAVLARLTAEGMLERRQGSGTYVARPLGPTSATGLTQEFSHRGVAFTTRCLSVTRRQAPSDLLASGEVAELRRLRLVGGEAVSLETTWLPSAVAERLDPDTLGSGSLYGALAGAGMAPADVTETLDATLADAAAAELLDCVAGAPLLRVRRTAHASGGTLIEESLTLLRADQFHLASRSDERPVGGLAAMLTFTTPTSRK